MFTTKRSNDLKLIDFGLATKLNPKDTVKITTGTAEFAAPEIAEGHPVGYYTDMWSVGVLSYILYDFRQGLIILSSLSAELRNFHSVFDNSSFAVL